MPGYGNSIINKDVEIIKKGSGMEIIKLSEHWQSRQKKKKEECFNK